MKTNWKLNRVVPQLIACWDDEDIDIDRTLTRIIYGTFHHPAQRDYGDDGAADGRRLMFGVVEGWWREKDEQERQVLRDQLSRNGVEQGRNHKPGILDKGHGCCKPLGMPTRETAQSSGAIGGLAGDLAGAGVIGQIGSALAGESKYDSGYTAGGDAATGSSGDVGKIVEEAAGGGALGSIVGGIAGAVGGNLLGEAFGGSSTKKKEQNSLYEADGSFTQNITQTGYAEPQHGGQQRYGHAEYSQTSFAEGGGRAQYQRYEQDSRQGRTGYGESVTQESRPTYGGGYEQTTETRYERPGGQWQSQVRVEGRDSDSGRIYQETKRYSGQAYKKDSDSNDSDGKKKKEKRKKQYKKRGSDKDDSDDSDGSNDAKERRQRFTESEFEDTSGSQNYGRSGYGGDQSYSQETGSGYGGRSSYGQETASGYGGRAGYGQDSQLGQNYGQDPTSGYGGRSTYGQEAGSGYGGRSNQGQEPRYEHGGLQSYGQEAGSGYDERSGYGEEAQSGYGGRSNYGQGSASGYGDSQSYGQESGSGYGGYSGE